MNVYHAIVTVVLGTGTRHTVWLSSDERDVVQDSAEYLALGAASAASRPAMVTYYTSDCPEGDPTPRGKRHPIEEAVLASEVMFPEMEELPF